MSILAVHEHEFEMNVIYLYVLVIPDGWVSRRATIYSKISKATTTKIYPNLF